MKVGLLFKTDANSDAQQRVGQGKSPPPFFFWAVAGYYIFSFVISVTSHETAFQTSHPLSLKSERGFLLLLLGVWGYLLSSSHWGEIGQSQNLELEIAWRLSQLMTLFRIGLIAFDNKRCDVPFGLLHWKRHPQLIEGFSGLTRDCSL